MGNSNPLTKMLNLRGRKRKDTVIVDELDGCTRHVGNMRLLDPSSVLYEFTDSEKGGEGDTNGHANHGY